MPGPRTTSLFHFTKTFGVLKNILKDGFLPFYSLEDIQWMGETERHFTAFPIVAFCDIPLSRITDHVSFYGKYGIGLSRKWGLANGLNPLVYLSENGPFADAYRKTMLNLFTTKGGDKFVNDIRFLIGFTKPIKGSMIVNGQPVDKEFYQESEWRYLARHADVPSHLKQTAFENDTTRQQANQKAQANCKLNFVPGDVQYLIVPEDSEIPDLVDFINRELDRFPSVDLKILGTRIVTLAAIEADV
jgi:hypothetical protein